MVRISVVVNTLNEEKNLGRCLESVKGFADEVVVVDMESDDKTREVAKSAGAKVYKHKRVGYVEPARNYAISKAQGEYILILDADEVLPETLAKKLAKMAADPKGADYYRLPRKNIIFGKWMRHSRWWPDYNIRFFKKGKVSWSEIIHAVPTTTGKGVDLEVTEETAIVHYHYESVEQYVERMNRYTSLHAKLRIKEGEKFKWPDLIKKPANEFLSRYFAGEGYKDGVHGLALASLQAFSELTLYLKIWSHSAKAPRDKQIGLKEVVGVMKEAEDDFHYWWADALVKSGGGVRQRIKRKLKLR